MIVKDIIYWYMYICGVYLGVLYIVGYSPVVYAVSVMTGSVGSGMILTESGSNSTGSNSTGSNSTGYILPPIVPTTGYNIQQHALRTAIFIKKRISKLSPHITVRLLERIDIMIKGSSESLNRKQLLEYIKFYLLVL